MKKDRSLISGEKLGEENQVHQRPKSHSRTMSFDSIKFYEKHSACRCAVT